MTQTNLIQNTYTIGRYEVVWLASHGAGPKVQAKVWEPNNNHRIVFTGTREECMAWAKKHNW